jgi:hypothetical protein
MYMYVCMYVCIYMLKDMYPRENARTNMHTRTQESSTYQREPVQRLQCAHAIGEDFNDIVGHVQRQEPAQAADGAVDIHEHVVVYVQML